MSIHISVKPSNIFSSETIWLLECRIGGLVFITFYFNDGLVLTLAYFTVRSNLDSYVFYMR